MTNREFLLSIKPGDIAPATTVSTGKLHLLRVREHRQLGDGRREVDEEQRLEHWKGRPLCGMDSSYFWKLHNDPRNDERCARCFARWRSLGRPPIRGLTKSEEVLQSAIKLPFGWEEVSTGAHPLDLREDAEFDEDKKEEEIGRRRFEIWRWIRGTRYVRVVQYTDIEVDYRYSVRAGVLERPKTDGYLLKTNELVTCFRYALTSMAMGGQNVNRSSWKQLQLPNGANV